MGAFVSTDTVRVVDGDDWVDIKSKLGAGDRARFTTAIYEMGGQAGTSGVNMRFNIGQVALVTLRLAIVAWSFPQAVTEANVGLIDMDAPLWAKVLAEINQRNPTLMELTGVGG